MKKLHKLCALLLSMAMAISCASLPAVAAEVGVSEETVVVSTDTGETTEEESEEEPAEEEGVDASEEESTEEEAADSSEESAAAGEEEEESAEEEAAVEAEEAEEADESVEAESTVPTATAESTLFGYGYTSGGSCLRGDTVDSLTGAATISLALDEGDIDDSLIDSSNATVKLVDGDGYYAAELILGATTLTGSWENGQTTYTMDVEDLVWDNTVYSGEMGVATRQWSAFGGDGNGCYTFYLEVSGITYNGEEVASTTFPVEVYIFGRDGTDRGTVFDTEVTLPTATESSSGKSQSSETQWTWSGDSSAGVPILCDSLADDFYITWPSGTDASGVTASDVTVTLSNEYGTTYTLETENAYGEQQYAVYSSAGETQVAVTFMHWSYTPVFTSMTITVDGGDGLTATKTYEVASVYAYIVQSGGRASGDGNVVTYSFYGLDLDSLTSVYQLAKDTEDYTLYTTVDDTTYYYAEDESGNGYLTTDEDEAAVYTQSTEVREPALVNSTVFIENRLTLTEDKAVDGETVTFTKELGNGDGNNNLYMKGTDVLANGVKAATGYVIGENLTPYDGTGARYGTLMPYEHWAWQTRFSAGWTSEDGTTATSFPYVSFPYGYAAGETPSTGGDEEEEEEPVKVSVTAESDIFGSADTGNKSTLKAELVYTSGPGDISLYYYNEDGERVQYEDQSETHEGDTVTYTGSATISLALPEGDIDDSKIDSSNAVVKLAEGDGYYPEELVLAATSLTGSWENGQLTYTLSEGDLEWYTGDYAWSDFNSGREWSCFGGDGNGYYTFNFEVSGITYDGVEVDPVQFQVNVYIWGRDGSDRVSSFNETESPEAVESSSGVSQTDEIQWTWSGDTTTGDPILCDNLADDFYITWPTGTDASGLTADDVTVTLYNAYGDSYTLQTENAYGEKQYSVFSSEGETQVAVTFMHWAYVPVFTTMTITVDGDGLTASKTYDVDSVYIYMVQQGGGGVTVDGTVTTYSYYGFANLDSVWQVMTESTYILTTTIDDVTYYYAEDGTLTTDKSEAQSFDATGEADTNQQLIGNTAWITTRLNQTEDKTVDGETITFDKSYSTGKTASASTAAANGLVAADGYILGSSITPYEMWAWQDRFLAGYTTSEAEPTGSPYVSFPYGYEAGETPSTGGETETVDTTALTAAIEQAEALTESDYTASTWSALQTALESAKTVAANANATQDEVDEAASALTAAIDALVAAANTTALTATIEQAEALTESDYTASTWAALQTALESAKTVAANADATQDEVDEATSALSAAIDALAAAEKVTVPDATKITSAVNKANGIKLTWNKVSTATSYQVYRKIGSGSWKKVKTTTSTTWTDTSATSNGTKYQYKVYAVNSAGKSKASATKTIYRLTAKHFTRAKNVSSRKISLKWTRNTKATGYQIQYSTSSSFSSSTTKTVTIKGNKNLTTTLKNLTKGKKYYIRMRAYKTSGSVTSYAGWSKVKTVTVKK